MIELYYEDFEVGRRFDCGAKTLSEAEIVDFARRFVPQPFHLDRAAGRASILGDLSASGWHTCAAIMRMFVDAVILRASSMGSPGVSESRWLKPVFPDVELRHVCEVTSARLSASRPDAGFVGFRTTTTAGDAPVCMQEFVVMFGRRVPGEATAAKRESGPKPAPAQPETPEILPGETMAHGSFDAVRLGPAYDLGGQEVTAEEIVAFAREFDPQPFHLDEAAGRASVFRGLAASGWHTTALWVKHMTAARKAAREAMPAELRAAAEAAQGPSPGFEDLRWRRPVLAGDRLRFFSQPIEKRDLASRPDWGLLVSRNWAENQRGEVAMSFTGKLLLRRG